MTWRGGSVVERCEQGIYTRVALGRLSLAIALRVGKNAEQLCAVATTDTSHRFTSPEP